MNTSDTVEAFDLMYPHHDLLIELGRLELAMEHLQNRPEADPAHLRPRLEQRRERLLQQLDQWAA